jgi:hypothetical protein
MIMPNLTISTIYSPEDLKHLDNNEYLVKFFNLLQWANEYHANQVKLAQNILKNTENEYKKVHNEMMANSEQLKARQSKLEKSKEAARKKNDLMVRYQYLIRHKNGLSEGMYYKCSNCVEKVFITRHGLIDHYTKVHKSEVPDVDFEPLVYQKDASKKPKMEFRPQEILKGKPVTQKSRKSMVSEYSET